MNERFLQAVPAEAARLAAGIGYEAREGDLGLMELCAGTVWREILNTCNLSEVPEELFSCAARLTAAVFFELKRACGSGDLAMLEERPVRRIKEGDMDVEFAGSAAGGEERLERFLAECRAYRGQLAAFRRLKW